VRPNPKPKFSKSTMLGVGERLPETASGIRTTNTAAAIQAVGLPAPRSIPIRMKTEIAALPLDPDAAFVLETIDGRTSLQDIVDLGTMPRMRTLEAIVRLSQLGVIAFT
jgi:hypothetical protein